jgi:hypothetical protein
MFRATLLQVAALAAHAERVVAHARGKLDVRVSQDYCWVRSKKYLVFAKLMVNLQR